MIESAGTAKVIYTVEPHPEDEGKAVVTRATCPGIFDSGQVVSAFGGNHPGNSNGFDGMTRATCPGIFDSGQVGRPQ